MFYLSFLSPQTKNIAKLVSEEGLSVLDKLKRVAQQNVSPSVMEMIERQNLRLLQVAKDDPPVIPQPGALPPSPPHQEPTKGVKQEPLDDDDVIDVDMVFFLISFFLKRFEI